jgi:hypothetical protein
MNIEKLDLLVEEIAGYIRAIRFNEENGNPANSRVFVSLLRQTAEELHREALAVESAAIAKVFSEVRR